jgi:hypothetical protein
MSVSLFTQAHSEKANQAMIIVFDTNIWIKELGLQSNAGAAVRFFISQKQAKVALPEVIKLELESNLCEQINECITNIKENHNKLLKLFGKLKKIVLPTKEEIDAKISDIIGLSGIPVIHIPFSFESAQSSFIKIINKLPPNWPKDQQFKDGVIWADCVRLLDDDDVVLVSNDGGFYNERIVEKDFIPLLSLILKIRNLGLPYARALLN